MPATIRTEASRIHPRESSFISVLSGWAQQGMQSFFATQRVLLDLAMRQNANVMHAFRHQLSNPQYSPTAFMGEMAGDGITNFIEGQRVLLELGKQQNEILMCGVKERMGDWPAAHALTDLLQRSVNTFLHMQEEFLKIAGKQTHTWVEQAKSGKPYQPEQLVDLAREGMENFVKAQKQFLDLIAEETARVAGTKRNGAMKKMKKTELAELARQATQSFIEAQKKLVDVAGKQMNASVKIADKTMGIMRPFPFLPLAELTRESVKSYVDAQKAIMEAMVKAGGEYKRAEAPARPKRARARAKAAGATA